MSDRELGDAGPLLLAAILLAFILAIAGCAHAPAPVVDVDAPNVFEKCKAKCAAHGKVAIAACETQDSYRCACEPDSA